MIPDEAAAFCVTFGMTGAEATICARLMGAEWRTHDELHISAHVLKTHICRIRAKLKPCGAQVWSVRENTIDGSAEWFPPGQKMWRASGYGMRPIDRMRVRVAVTARASLIEASLPAHMR